ncbi:APC family permease [Commensalibacter nepenthis]|uniref:Amino acid permease n=1 Tax=Commensalibacter nepenthis TaxID=3043872 RepID=A0ABT6Q5J2_9PROT|nr:amino acid permease [Commensalibacter sp. TBRC 10068]MDI2112163.1 amino acid permease [Commensalibacter sp. TBRC 10068]
MALISKRKSLEQITKEADSHNLHRCLGPWRLTTIGVGATVGAGIFVMTGTAAANFAGPAVVLSFIIAAIACLFTALSYGELSSTIPVAGSAYSYAYTSLGEKFAWAVGWLLLLEYGISAVSVASGFSSYSVSLLQDLHINLPSFIHHPMFQPSPEGYNKGIIIVKSMDLVGAMCVMMASIALLFGVSESTTINGIIVTIKVGILILFIAIGFFYINPMNLTPFIPESTGAMNFGTTGIFRAASTTFFAYIGFEVVSTAASEAKNPQKDVPFGIVASLGISTLIYIGVAIVLVGVVPYKQLNVSDPLAIATNYINIPFLTWTLKISAVIGLCSVMLALLYGQTRIFFIMAKDGLLPPAFCGLHPRYKTPWRGTLILGVCVSIATAFLPIDIISDLVSLGTASAFIIVCFTVIWQRNAHPDLPRPFEVPLGGFYLREIWIGYIPMLGIISCIAMIIPLLIDMVSSIFHHNPIPMILLISYAVVGFFGYYGYGRKHSVIGKQHQSPNQS